MAAFIRAKRVTDPLDDKVKAQLRGDDRCMMAGYASSGSEHEVADPSCFSGLVHAFLEDDGHGATFTSAPDASNQGGDSDEDGEDRSTEEADTLRGLLEASSDKEDAFRVKLLSEVSHAVEGLAELRQKETGYRREVMHRLRESGYNAGLCKAKWGSRHKITAGNYEYIDVCTTINDGSEKRYIVDLDFAGQFEIARATEEYERVIEALPRVMVGTAEEVRRVIQVVGHAAKRSLKSRGLHLPPWRKTRYMLAKWLGPYRRTINTIPSSAGTALAVGAEIKCRAVGFHAAPGLVIAPVARTR